MATVVNTSLSKICHARIGQFVRLPDVKTGHVLPEVFVVVAVDDARCRPARPGMSQGLYDEGRELFLVSLESGRARAMPHLSSRAELLSAKDYFDALGREVPSLVTPERPAAVSDAPVWAQIQYRTKRGTEQTVEVDLADSEAVSGFLEVLQATEGQLLSVKEERHLEPVEQLRAQWRRDVAMAKTLRSFEEYQQAV